MKQRKDSVEKKRRTEGQRDVVRLLKKKGLCRAVLYKLITVCNVV
jgi:hypothetical protein